jgi:hypothetical protein
MWRVNGRMSIHTQIPVAQIIREEDNEIWMFNLVCSALLKLERGCQDQHQVQKGCLHYDAIKNGLIHGIQQEVSQPGCLIESAALQTFLAQRH